MKILLVGANSTACRAWLKHGVVVRNAELIGISRKPPMAQPKVKWAGDMEGFSISDHFDIVVNFVGASNPSQLRMENATLQSAMRKSDELSSRLASEGSTYIFLSSGAVYRSLPGDGTEQKWKSAQFYTAEKLAAEERHRSIGAKISDLRIFGYASKLQKPWPETFLGALLKAKSTHGEMQLSNPKMQRDYLSDSQLARILDCLSLSEHSGPVDAYTSEPATLAGICEAVGVLWHPKATLSDSSPTGEKSHYFSEDRKLVSFGYRTDQNSTDVVRDVLEHWLKSE